LTEERNDEGEMWAYARAQAVLSANRQRPLEDSLSVLVEVIVRWRGSPHLRDDVAILAAEMGARCPPRREWEDPMPMNELPARFRFPARSDKLHEIRHFVQKILGALGCSREFIDTTVLAIDEAATNVIRHAYGGDPSGEAELEIERQGDVLHFRLTDSATPIDRSKIRPRKLSDIRPGGLGVHIIQEVMDTMEFVDPPDGAVGNVLVMTRRLEDRSQPEQ
jgi:anti-sigma regulatory factor (Ser/Thr protein kinase)